MLKTEIDRRHFKAVASLSGFWLVLLLAMPALATEIRFRESAAVPGTTVQLGEIADIAPASELTRRLAAKTVCRAPLLGKSLTLRGGELRSYLSQTDSDFHEVTWSGAETTTITREGVTLSEERILTIIDDYLRDRMAVRQATFQFTPFQPLKPLQLPTGKLNWELVPGGGDNAGNRSFTLIFKVNGEAAANIVVRGALKVTAPVVVAALNLPRGRILAPADLKLVTMELTQARTPCQNIDELVGKKLKRMLRAGDMVDQAQVELPAMVRRGQVVTLVAGRGALRISATGVARADGRAGDTIRVVNNSSGRDVFCRVVGPGQVQVDY